MQRQVLVEREELDEPGSLVGFTVDVVAAHLAHNSVPVDAVPDFISKVHAALKALDTGAVEAEAEVRGAVPIMDPRKAVKRDSITCLVCGKKGKILKAHLKAAHGLRVDEYRAKFGLPESYPTTSQNYRDAARERAQRLGLGARMQEGKTRAALVAVGRGTKAT